jgi:N-acetylmuramoyl-L-alanine amidase
MEFIVKSKKFSKVKFLFYLILLTNLLILGFTDRKNKDEESVPHYQIKTVVLDAGHGGHDAGCNGAMAYEKKVALGIVLKLGKYIEEKLPDVKVIYTRKTDVFVELNERAAIANRNNADIFISVHCNSARNKEAYGTETWVMGLHKNESNLEVAKRENEVILLEDDYEKKYEYNPNNPLSHIIFSLYQNAFLDQSIGLANQVQNQFRQRAGRKDRGVKQAGFVVLYKTAMPSVLIESGFLTNRDEEKYLKSELGQDLIASAIFRAFRDYKYELEQESSELTGSPKSGELAKRKDEREKKEGEKSNAKNIKTDSPNNDKTSKKEEITETGEQAQLPGGDEIKEKDQLQKTISDEKSEKLPEVPKSESIEFRIQIFASSRLIDKGKVPFSKLTGIYEELINEKIYRYFYGRFGNVAQTKEALTKAKKAGFSDAFIVAYKNGKRLGHEEVLGLFGNAD